MMRCLKPSSFAPLLLVLFVGLSLAASREARGQDDTAVRLEGDGVVVYEPATGATRVLPYTSLFKWRPNSQQAAILVDERLALFDASTGEVTRMSIPAEPFSDSAWSHDGAYFAFTQRSGDKLYAKLFHPASGRVTTVARATSGSFGGQVWSPDGRYLVVHRERGLAFIRIDDRPTRVRTECDFGGLVGWVSNSRFLCLRLARPGRMALSLVQLSSESSNRVARLGLESQSITISPGIPRIAVFAGKTLNFYDARTLEPIFSTRRVTPRREGKSSSLVPLVWSPDGNAIAQAGVNVVAAHRVNMNGVSRALALLRPAPPVGWAGDGHRFLSCERRFIGINKAGGVDVDLPQFQRGKWSPDQHFSAWVPYGGFNQDNHVRVARTDGSVVRTAMVTKYHPYVIGWSDDSRFLASSAHEPKEGAEWYPQPCEIVQPWARDPAYKPGNHVVIRTGNDPVLIRVRPGNAAPVEREEQDGAVLTLARGPLVVDGLRWWEFEGGGWCPDVDFKPAAGASGVEYVLQDDRED